MSGVGWSKTSEATAATRVGRSADVSEPADRRSTERTAVLLFAAAVGLLFLDRLGIAFVFADIRAELHLDNTQLGLLMSVTALSWAASAIVMSFLSDRLGGKAKLIITLSILGFSLATGLAGLATSFGSLLVVRALMGLFEGPALPLIQSSVQRISNVARAGRNLGIVMAATAIFGGGLPPIIMPALAQSLGWRGAFYALAVPGFLIALALAFAMPNGSAASETTPPRLREALALFRERNVLLAGWGAIMLIGYTVAVASFLPLFVRDLVPLSPGGMMLFLTAIGFGGTIGNLLAPALSDRLPRKLCLLVSIATLTATPVLIVFSPGMPSLLIPAVLTAALGGGAAAMNVFVMPGNSVPLELNATTFALVMAIGEVVGGTSAPALAGFAADRYGLGAAMWSAFGLGVLAFAGGAAMREPERRQV